MDRSPGFGSIARNYIRPIQTRSRFASGAQHLKLAPYNNSPDRSTKSTSSHSPQLPTGFHVSGGTLDTRWYTSVFVYGALTHYGRPSHAVQLT